MTKFVMKFVLAYSKWTFHNFSNIHGNIFIAEESKTVLSSKEV